MSKTSTLGFYFNKVQKGDLYPSHAYIYVKNWSTGPRGKDVKNGDKCILLTPEIASASELDAHVDRLIRELEKIRALGKRICCKSL
jgi:hypothetical protein